MSAESSQAVFLSYASQDAEAARRMAGALRAAGVEVWFDQNELVGGDAWDAKIRRQIAECALFVPVISANTQARLEGYFRVEWRLAAQRTHAMAEEKAFLLPVVIDDTRGDSDAKVPAEFKAAQWTRLAGGHAPPAFGERVRRLVDSVEDGRPGERSPRGEVRGPLADPRTGKATRPRPRWIVPAITGAVGCAVLASWFFQSRGGWSASDSKPRTSNSGVPLAAMPMTETRKLAEQARALLNSDDANRENFTLAEELLRKAIGLDPADGEALAVYAELSTSSVRFGFDRSDARRELARAQAERAVKLAPAAFEARFAQAYQYYLLGPREGERLTRELLRERPGDRRLLFTLGLMLSNQGRVDDAYQIFRQVAELPGGDAHALREIGNLHLARREWVSADKALAESIQIQPLMRSRWARVLSLLYGRGDLEGALNGVRELPAWAVLEDRGAYLTSLVHLWRRKPDEAILALNRVPRDYFADNWFTGPKSYLLGLAQSLAGRMEAARTEWQNALALVEKKRAADPRSTDLLYWRARTLAALGRTEEAVKAQVLYDESEGNSNVKRARLAKIDVLLGRADAALDNLESHLALHLDSLEEPLSVEALRLDPTWDPLHGNPRYEKLVATLQSAAPNANLQTPISKPADTADLKSIAVLAFKNLSGDKEQEYFSDGLSEELSNVLGRVPGLRVAGSTSAFSFKVNPPPLREMARQLGVAHLVEGTVRKEGNTVHITAKLINAADGFAVWTSENFKREVKSSLAVQEEIAGLIAKALSLKLGVASPASTAEVNPQAFEFYLQGRQAWNLRTAASLERAAAQFRRALELDPNFARALAGLADIWVVSAPATGIPRAAAQRAEIVAHAERAIALDSSLAEPHATLGCLESGEWNFEAAERHFQRALAINRNYAWAHFWRAQSLATQGRMEEALMESRLALDADPLAPRILSNQALLELLAGRPAAALASADLCLSLQPDNEQAQIWKAEALLMLGREADALKLARDTSAIPPHRTGFTYVFARAGTAHEAAVALASPDGRFALPTRARLAAGGTEEAFGALEADARTTIFAFQFVLFHPAFDAIRSDARFVKMLENVRMTEAHARAQAWRAANVNRR